MALPRASTHRGAGTGEAPRIDAHAGRETGMVYAWRTARVGAARAERDASRQQADRPAALPRAPAHLRRSGFWRASPGCTIFFEQGRAPHARRNRATQEAIRTPMATVNPTPNLTGLALRLVRENLLAAGEAERLQADALAKKVPFVTQLVESKKLEAKVVARVASEEFGVPMFDINALDLTAAPVKLVDEKILRRHRVLPLHKRGSRLYVAIADPTNLQALDEIKFHTGLGTEAILVEEDKLTVAIEKCLEAADTSLADMAADDSLEGLDLVAGDEESEPVAGADEGVNDTPIVKFVNKVLLDAINRGASDIHIEPYEKTYRVRYRLDGVLQEVANPPLALANRIAARVKILSRLDIAERRVPQDGRIKMRISRN